MPEQAETLDILTITGGNRRIGIDRTEIKDVFPAAADALLEEYRSRQEAYRLEDLTGGKGDAAGVSALVVKAGGSTRLVTFTGTTGEQRVRLRDILPLPELLRRKQDPFVVWGMVEEENTEQEDAGPGALLLVTFQFLPQKGAS